MRRTAKVGGLVISVGAGLAALAWMLRDRLVRPTVVPVSPEDAPAFRVSPPTAAARADADDLTEIKGIGPVFSARLAAAGISRFDELAATSGSRLAEIAGVPETRAAEWISQARSRV